MNQEQTDIIANENLSWHNLSGVKEKYPGVEYLYKISADANPYLSNNSEVRVSERLHEELRSIRADEAKQGGEYCMLTVFDRCGSNEILEANVRQNNLETETALIPGKNDIVKRFVVRNASVSKQDNGSFMINGDAAEISEDLYQRLRQSENENQGKNDLSASYEAAPEVVPEPEEISFYHISRKAETEVQDSFCRDGFQPGKGIGAGGQRSGVYFWTREDYANNCYLGWLSGKDVKWAKESLGRNDLELKDGKALKLAVNIKTDNIKYPLWEIDAEQHPKAELGKHEAVTLSLWRAAKDYFAAGPQVDIDFATQQEKGQITSLGWDDKFDVPVAVVNGEKRALCQRGKSTLAEYSGQTQAVNDYLIRNCPEYQEAYNQMLKAVALGQEKVEINGQKINIEKTAIKYCGDENIPVSKLSLMQGKVLSNEDRNYPEGYKAVRYDGYDMAYKENLRQENGFEQNIAQSKSMNAQEQWQFYNSDTVKYNAAEHIRNTKERLLKNRGITEVASPRQNVISSPQPLRATSNSR